jgi:mannose-6-phosphate isomerase-like protein (cupin superfamily)
METDDLKTAWISRAWSKKDKPWGHEMSWSSFTAGHGKLLFIAKGCRTSLKFNPQKNESLLVLSGKLKVTFGDELSLKWPDSHPMQTEILESGGCLHVQSYCPYRLEALEDSEVIEIGNYLNDVPVRIEDDYGRVDEKNT